MNIILLTSCLGRGGAERVATILCNAWAERGDQVMLIPTFSGGGKAGYDLAPGVKLVFLADVAGAGRKTPASYLRRLLRLRALISRQRPDVVSSFLPNVNVAAIAATAFLGVPLIVCERSDPSARSARDFWEFWCRATYRFADMLTVQTEAVAAKAQEIYRGVPVRRLPNPVLDPGRRSPDRRMHPRRILLSLGRLAPEKQIDIVVEAFAGIAARFSEWDLHVYGDGPERARLAALIAAHGLQDRIVLMGQTGNAARVMATADAFVMASRYEGFPNALLEAMSAGLPCAAFDCPSGPREMTRNGRDALLVPLDDRPALTMAFVRLMEDEGLRETLGARARQSVLGRFGLDAVLHEWDRAFREVGVRGAEAVAANDA
jgi:glycosyltransferase involved in cell wall biosynthesis